jgi:hypothetical protein
LQRVSAGLAQLRARVEELEDLRDLNPAVTRNAGKPGTAWAQVRKGLGLSGG